MDAEDEDENASVVDLDVCETSPNFFDFMEDPELEKNIQDVDQIGMFCGFYLSSLSSHKKSILESNNKQLFAMLSCFAYDSVSTTKPTTTQQEVWLLSTTAFQNAYDNLFMREEYFTQLLSKFPNKTWPSSFAEYVENLQDRVNPTEKWIASNAKIYKTADAHLLRKLYFGYKIVSLAKDAFKEIKLHYNRYTQ